MRKLGEQWIEIIDGHEHMLKAVAPVFDCQGCMYLAEEGCVNSYLIINCGIGKRFIIKDLGILNEDGCLTNCWGEYPRIEELVDVHTREHWFRCITRNNVYCATESYKTKQEAIDAWNRRA